MIYVFISQSMIAGYKKLQYCIYNYQLNLVLYGTMLVKI